MPLPWVPGTAQPLPFPLSAPPGTSGTTLAGTGTLATGEIQGPGGITLNGRGTLTATPVAPGPPADITVIIGATASRAQVTAATGTQDGGKQIGPTALSRGR